MKRSVAASIHTSRKPSFIKRCIAAVILVIVAITALLPFFFVYPNAGPITESGRQASRTAHQESPDRSKDPNYHLVFSTSCTDQQNWESFVFFYHCRRVRQPGNVTRIASGCRPEDAAKLQTFHERYIASMAVHPLQHFALHLTPDYSRAGATEGYKQSYKYNNKPFGLLDWMEHSLGLRSQASPVAATKDHYSSIASPFSDAGQRNEHQKLLDGIVILMDPDMILLRPIRHDFDEHEQWVEKPIHTKVTHGHPVAQQDGYLGNDWMKLNFTYITGDASIVRPAWKEGPVHWNTGPPYLATVADMYRIARLWTDLAPRVLRVYPHLFAEMYSFIIATVMLQLPFALTKSIVVSTPEATNREGWSLVDAIPNRDICRVPTLATSGSSPVQELPILPTGLHYCKRYMLGKSMFSKYRIKKNIMSCDKNLLKPPPDDLVPNVDYMIAPPRSDGKDAATYTEVRQTISVKRAKRENFMLCGMISAVNEALRFFKQQACGKNGAPVANLNETYTIHDDPSDY